MPPSLLIIAYLRTSNKAPAVQADSYQRLERDHEHVTIRRAARVDRLDRGHAVFDSRVVDDGGVQRRRQGELPSIWPSRSCTVVVPLLMLVRLISSTSA